MFCVNITQNICIYQKYSFSLRKNNTDMKTQDSRSFILKTCLMAVLSLLLLIPLQMVKEQVRERRSYRNDCINEIEDSWAGWQEFSGPKISYYTTEYTKDEKGKPEKVVKENFLYPEELKIDANVETQNLHRAIYDVTVYNSELKVDGNFIVPEAMKGLKDALVQLSISDLRGVEGKAEIRFGDKTYPFVASGTTSVIETSVEVPAAVGSQIPFSMTLNIKGSSSLKFKPVGEITEVSISSNCASPSFTGEFLPGKRDVREDGFTASWSISEINRGAPESKTFGVKLLSGVDQYQQTERCMKYGILIILLVFLAGFIVELVTRKDINIIQYLVIGLSLVLFYALLLSFSEFMDFGLSYLIAAAMTVLALTGYFRGILKSKVAYLLGLFTAIAYAVCYVLLQMETYALLTGTLLLFVCLVVVMYLTRNLRFVKSETKQ